ncbi:MAG TPA: aspartyl/asparaginyl beta-hydroxylase domain-containing protein [Vicinamibacterales bacterium]|jgi:ornithine lipid ester-linked acyl 2-hydroxylase|nr:aspartyl/asparaginyl beta-hydroxylase domain-containing protein [Vicinamibacterales bacterium]
MVRDLVEKALFFRDGTRTFFEPEEFPWVAEIEAEWKTIRKELDALMVRREEIPNFQDLSKSQAALTEGDQWKTFFFYLFGNKYKENCLRCPETVRLLKKIPGMRTGMFSILAPGKHIPAHRGPYKGVLRLHLGLMIPPPEGGCRIRVGNDVRAWREGKSLIFDDSNEHEVWNDCDAHRVVLFVDFVRPTIFPLSLVNLAIIWLRGRYPL